MTVTIGGELGTVGPVLLKFRRHGAGFTFKTKVRPSLLNSAGTLPLVRLKQVLVPRTT